MTIKSSKEVSITFEAIGVTDKFVVGVLESMRECAVQYCREGLVEGGVLREWRVIVRDNN